MSRSDAFFPPKYGGKIDPWIIISKIATTQVLITLLEVDLMNSKVD